MSALSLLISGSFGWADMESQSYKLAQTFVSGGGGNATASAAYKIDEGSVDYASKELMAGANYQAEGLIGASHGVNTPLIEAVTPAGLARFFTDENASYAVTARDTEGGALQYQLRLENQVKIPWQPGATLAYALGAADKGRHGLSVEVKDSDGTTAQAAQHYVFRRPLR